MELEQGLNELVTMGLPGIVIAGLSVAIGTLHRDYKASQNARVTEAQASAEKLYAALQTLDRITQAK